jgi:hypothetical protein
MSPDRRVDVETSHRWTHPKPAVCCVTLAAVPTEVELISVRRLRQLCETDASLQVSPAEGTRRIYRLNEAGVAALRDQLDTFWNRALASYQDVAEQPTEEHP